MQRSIRAAAYVFLTALLGVSARAVDQPATFPSTVPASRPTPLKIGDNRREILVDGRNRSYWVHVPPGYEPTKPTPVVLAFHGAMMNGAMMAGFSGLSRKSDAAGFIVVYPNGTGFGEAVLFFNASAPAGKDPNKSPPDDVAFTAKLLDELATIANVDPKRVFVTGMSNGGMMSHRLGAELSNRIAAIAPVAGTLAIDELKPKRPVPVIHFHGSDDTIVPWGGPKGMVPTTMRFKSVDDTIQEWIKANGCSTTPTQSTIADNKKEGTPVTISTYGGGKDGAQVVLVEIKGGGHTWPGEQPPVKWIGKSASNISANDLIWDFFQKHPMR